MKEKEKIYNNIMNNRKKTFDFRILFPIGAVCLIVLGIFLFKGPSNILHNPNPIESKKDRNYKLENNYKKEIITNVGKYLEANYIDVSELKEGEELVIEVNKIVEDDKYSTCKGNLVITRYYDSYSYDPKITCDGTDNDDQEERKFILYSGEFDKTFEVDDYIVISSKYNVSKMPVKVHNIQTNEYSTSEMITDNDINITVFDKEGNVVLSKLIESKYPDEDSTMSVTSVNIIDDYYYVNMQISHDRNFNEFGGGSEIVDSYEIIFDKDGKEILYNKIVSQDGSPVSINAYLGYEEDAIYYTGYNYTDNVIVKITKDKIETISYDVKGENSSGIAVNYKLQSYFEDGYYGYSYIKTYVEKAYYSARELIKLDKDGNLLWSKTVVPENYNIHKIIAQNDKVFILSGYSNNADYYKMLTVTDLDGEVISSIDVGSLVKKLDNLGNVDFYVDDNIVLVISDIYNTNKYFAVVDKDLNKIKTIDINESSAAYEFDYAYLAFSRLNGDKYTNVYSVDSSFFDGQAILMIISNVTENDIEVDDNEIINEVPLENDID